MLVYRISKRAYIQDLSGIGAGLHGGRWNPKGVNLVYTSGSISLASLEYLVHNYHLLSSMEICMAKIELHETASMLDFPLAELPENWNSPQTQNFQTQKIGASFVADRTHYALKIPSAVVPGEFNILLNPLHPAHQKTDIIEIIDPFLYDGRIVNQLGK